MRRATFGVLLALLVVAAPVSGHVALAGPADDADGSGLPERWTQTVGGDGDDKLATGVKTEDGYLVVGWSNGAGDAEDEHDGYVAMLDRTGETKWTNHYGGSGADRIYDVEKVDGGYLVAGTKTVAGSGSLDGWVMKLGPDGKKLWERTYGGENPDEFWSLAESDGHIYVGGFQNDGYAEAWAMELDDRGQAVWSETYGTVRSGSNEYVNSIFVTDGGKLLMTGTITGSGADPSDAWVLKVGGDGEVEWDRTYGGGEYDRVHDAAATDDGGFVLAGQTASQGEGEKDGWMLKIGSSGEPRWERTFGTKRMDAFFGIHNDPDGGFVVSGTKHVLGTKGADGWMVKTDGNGRHQWAKTYGGEFWDKFWPVVEGHGSGYLAVGESTSYNDNRDGWVVRVGGPAVAAIRDANATAEGTTVVLEGSPVRAVTLSNSNVSGVLAVAERTNVSALSPPGDPIYAVTVDGPKLAENVGATVEFEVRTGVVEANVSDLRVARRTDDGWSILNTTVVSRTNGTAILSAAADTNSTLAVTAVSAPTASIDAKRVVTVGESAELSAGRSTAANGTLAAYRWRVGGESHAGQSVNVSFDSPGERAVELTVTDRNGLRDSATATLVVNDRPEVSVETPESATVGEARTLSADVSDEVGNVTVTWKVDGATVTGRTVEHSFGSPGTATVTVVVEDEYGATVTKEVEVQVESRGSDAGGATGTTTATPNADGSSSVPGFGVGVTLVALLGAALLARAVRE